MGEAGGGEGWQLTCWEEGDMHAFTLLLLSSLCLLSLSLLSSLPPSYIKIIQTVR